MTYIPDSYDYFLKHDAEREREVATLPICGYCGEPIQEEYCIEIDGEYFHEECFMNEHRKSTEIVARW